MDISAIYFKNVFKIEIIDQKVVGKLQSGGLVFTIIFAHVQKCLTESSPLFSIFIHDLLHSKIILFLTHVFIRDKVIWVIQHGIILHQILFKKGHITTGREHSDS